MKLQEILDNLTYGELSQLSVGGMEEGGFQLENLPKIAPHINLGLAAIYKRFTLAYDECWINLYDHIDVYTLHSRFAETNMDSAEMYRYIADSPLKPFQDNVLRIDRVFNEVGEEVFSNDENRGYGYFTPTYNTIQVPDPNNQNTIRVVFIRAPDKIPSTGIDPTTYEVELSVTHLEPLLYFVGARLFTAMGTAESSNADSMLYMSKYENACREIEVYGLVQKDNLSNHKALQRGWI